MICFIASNFNSYSQFDYDADIRSIVLFLVPCPHCSARGAFIFYGHYSRSYFSLTDGSICFLRIQRVRCRHCHHTHALLPHFLVPFRRFQLGHLLSVRTFLCLIYISSEIIAPALRCKATDLPCGDNPTGTIACR